MTKRSIGGLNVDPNVQRMLDQAPTNRAARSAKQRYDSERTRIKLDVPPLIKHTLDTQAADYGTSTSQLGATLIAWSLTLLLADDPALDEYLSSHLATSRALRIRNDIELADLLEKLKSHLPDGPPRDR